MKTDQKKNKKSFKLVELTKEELTKEELRTIDGGYVINPPSDGPIVKGVRPY